MTTEALDAIARLDDGTALPGDDGIAALFDKHASPNWARIDVQLDRWAADRCVICGGPSGPECDGCVSDYEAVMKRAGDL